MPLPVIARPFVDTPPSVVNAVEIFSGEWACSFPPGFPAFQGAGTAAAFEDPRITWAEARLAKLGHGFRNADVLELGPLEAAHTYMMSRLGAREIISIENNARAFLKCLVVKEVLDIARTHFLLGDALAYIRANSRHFNIGVASAFLNHLVNPVEVIQQFSRFCDSIFLWNVVYDESLFVKQPGLRPTFGPPQPANVGGFSHQLYPHDYGDVADHARFWGGSQPSCCWMTSADILAAVKFFGFTRIESSEDEHPYGKSLIVAAAK